MKAETLFEVGGYKLASDRYYDADHHFWIEAAQSGGARCGFDPLGSETSGDIVAVSFEPVGTHITRGEAFGSIEAAKFVGPLIAPVSGVLRGRNEAVILTPSLLNSDPMQHWMVEFELAEPEVELAALLQGEQRVTSWFAAEIEKFRKKGMIAE